MENQDRDLILSKNFEQVDLNVPNYNLWKSKTSNVHLLTPILEVPGHRKFKLLKINSLSDIENELKFSIEFTYLTSVQLTLILQQLVTNQ